MHGIWRVHVSPLVRNLTILCDPRVRMIDHHYSISSVIFLCFSLISVIFRHFFVVMSGTRRECFYFQIDFGIRILWHFWSKMDIFRGNLSKTFLLLKPVLLFLRCFTSLFPPHDSWSEKLTYFWPKKVVLPSGEIDKMSNLVGIPAWHSHPSPLV
jgi:hypothetical protein